MLFLIEVNPGPGLGVLLAFTLFGKGQSKTTAPGAIIILLLVEYMKYISIHINETKHQLRNSRRNGKVTLNLTNAGKHSTSITRFNNSSIDNDNAEITGK